jgi:RNase P subunit RPR2
MSSLFKRMSLKIRNHETIGNRICRQCILLSYRTNNVRVALKELGENLGHTAGMRRGTDSVVQVTQIWVWGVVGRLMRKLDLRACREPWALPEITLTEFFDEILGIPILDLCDNCLWITRYTLLDKVMRMEW